MRHLGFGKQIAAEEWRAQFLPNGQGTIVVKTIVSTLFKAGLDSLKSRF